MTATVEASGTQTATLDTEHTLATVTSAGSFVLYVDVSAMANADVTILRVYKKVLTGGTSRLAHEVTLSNVQTEKVVYNDPIASAFEFIATLEQTDGTGRAYDWEVVSL